MAITTTCSGCGKTLAVAEEFAGRQARCPACGQIYTVPTPASAAPLSSGSGTSNGLDATVGYNPAPLDLGTPTASAPMPSDVAPISPINTGAPAAPIAPINNSGSLDPNGGNIQYWMKANNGAEYGPADSATLARWFAEGRVGQDYQIRIGQTGHWQPAAAFQSVVNGPATQAANGANPFAAASTFTPGVATGRTYEKGDQSGLVLAMGILAWLGGCPIFGIIGWVVGAQVLADMNAGQSDPSNRGIVQVGYYLSMVNVIVFIACGGLMLVGFAIAAINS